MAFATPRLSKALEQCVAALPQPPTGYCVALSGGLDSTVLLAALARLRDEGVLAAIRACHVDHGLHADAGAWARACALLADRLGISCAQLAVDARHRPGESPEAAARVARYRALAAALGEGEVLLTAHHADDQLEGILLQWLRGGGLRAVAGMGRMVPFAAGWHARPLLEFTREELHSWARRVGLEWLEDPSNRDTRFDRNYLRQEVLPILRQRWPAAARTVGRVARQAAEALEIESSLATADLAAVARGSALSLDALRMLPPARQNLVLRAWLRSLGLPVPSQRTLAALRHDMLEAAQDRVPTVDWPGAAVHRYRGHLYATTREDERVTIPGGDWMVGTTFDLGGLGRLELVAATGAGLRREGLPAVLQIAARRGGETFRTAGSAHRRPLRKWLQERGILPWRREQVPLVNIAGEIAAIGDFAYGGAHAAAPGEPSWLIAWRGRAPFTEREAFGLAEVAGKGPLR
ncbi:MAG: tRNA lysidine(34) synthetase TilS [Steroidobacteraceae bacterium]